MVFSEPTFLFLFLPLVLALYFATPVRLKNVLLLAASLLFYAWDEKSYALVMVVSIAFNYGMGLWVRGTRGTPWSRRAIACCVVGNLALLVGFKYANFIVSNVDLVLGSLGLPVIGLPPVHLPIGISFFTFQAMSYVIDVYRDDAPVQRNPLHLALYVSLFPQLIAGPIVRYTTVAAAIENRRVGVVGFASGVERFVAGLAKKVLVANPAGLRADEVFALSAPELGAPVAWLGVVCYAIQIYFDFSGYSDMAIGLGRMFGFEFLENFLHPYVSTSITEFWRRWHVSLSTWFRDYLYIPLGGSRGSALRTYRNLLIVFVLCGFWHGASWSFLVWGLLHGVLLVVERLGRGRGLVRMPRAARHAYVLLLVLVAWVFFRADTLPQAIDFLRAMFTGGAVAPNAQPFAYYFDVETALLLVVGFVGATPVLAAVRARFGPTLRPGLRGVLATGTTVLLLFLSAIFMAGGTYNPFIYFRF